MESESLGNNPYIWESLYEKAIIEADVNLRVQRLLEAEKAILERATTLDADAGDHEVEAQALEEAAEFIREMKLATQTDGVGKQITVGDQDSLLRKTHSPLDPANPDDETHQPS